MQSPCETAWSSSGGESGGEVAHLFHHPLLYYPLTHIKRFFFLLMQGPRIGHGNRGIPPPGIRRKGPGGRMCE